MTVAVGAATSGAAADLGGRGLRLAPDAPQPDLEALDEAARRATQVVTAGERLLPVAEPFVPLLPRGGLQRGSMVAITGKGGATSTALALVTAASAAGSWVAVVGTPRLGLLAAHELGMALDRCALIDEPPPGQWGQVVGALIGGVDIVVTSAPRRARTRDVRRVAARLRERGTVLIQLGDAIADLGLEVTTLAWEGIGEGRGRLLARRVRVRRSGRGGASRPVEVEMWLPGHDGQVTLVLPEQETGTEWAGVHRLRTAAS